MDYPKMIYRGGDLSSDQLIVQDEAEEDVAEKDGFWAHDRQPKKAAAQPSAAPAEAEPAEMPPKPKGKPGPKPKAA